MSRLEWKIAGRYLKSRRSSRLVSLITLIATGGVAVGVMALVIVMGVMNGLQNELRDRILIGSAHLQILTYGTELRVDGWRDALPVIRGHPEVDAASPFVITQGLIGTGNSYNEGVILKGLAGFKAYDGFDFFGGDRAVADDLNVAQARILFNIEDQAEHLPPVPFEALELGLELELAQDRVPGE